MDAEEKQESWKFQMARGSCYTALLDRAGPACTADQIRKWTTRGNMMRKGDVLHGAEWFDRPFLLTWPTFFAQQGDRWLPAVRGLGLLD